ncbi:MAG: hypothetical protein HQK51_03435 [Oligoflexia bacterium]|nr:hypothetical protein [Oligoflexia bacterium]
MKKIILLVFLVLVVFASTTLQFSMVSCDAHSLETVLLDNSNKWHTGALMTRGHEDLLHYAVKEANRILNNNFYPSVKLGVPAVDTSNQLVRGSYETDFPGNKIKSHYGNVHDWHNEDHLQSLHFLRKYSIGSNLYQSCLDGTNLILEITNLAWENYKNGDMNSFNFWLGHACHIIQDSFSPAHARREGPDNKYIVDICSYGKKVPGACFHEKVEVDDDRVWRNSLNCSMNPFNRPFNCLKPLAQSSVNATTSYLVAVARALMADKDPAIMVKMFFSFMGGGYFSCERLK